MPGPDFKTVHLLDLWKTYKMKNRPDPLRSTLAKCLRVSTCWGCGGAGITEHFLHSALTQQALWSDQWKKLSTLPQHSGSQKSLTLRIKNSKHFFSYLLYSNNQDRHLILPTVLPNRYHFPVLLMRQQTQLGWILCLLTCLLVVKSLSRIQPFVTPWSVAHQACPWDFPGKNTGAGCHFLLQGIFVTWGSNPWLLHWQVDSLPLSHQESC